MGLGVLLGLKHSRATWEPLGEGMWPVEAAYGSFLEGLLCCLPAHLSPSPSLWAWCPAPSCFVLHLALLLPQMCPSLQSFQSRIVACQAHCVPVLCWNCGPLGAGSILVLSQCAPCPQPGLTSILLMPRQSKRVKLVAKSGVKDFP